MIKKLFSKKSAKKAQENANPPLPDFSIAETLQMAIQLHQTGDWAKAQQLYQRILQYEPTHFDALHFSGILAYQSGNYALAVELINKAIAVHPSTAMYSNLAVVFQAAGDVEQLIKTYQQSLLLENNAEIHYKVANLLQSAGRLDEAVNHYRQALLMIPDAVNVLNNLGVAFQTQEKFTEAMACFQRIIALKPEFIEAYNNLGIIFQTQKRLEEAVASYQRAISLNPDYVEAHYNLGNSLNLQGHHEQAIGSYQKALLINPDYADAYYGLGNVFEQLEELDQSVASYEKALRINSDFLRARNNLGAVLLKQLKFEQAMACFQHILAKNPKLADAYYNLAEILKNKGDLKAAIDNYEKAIELDPDYSEAHYRLGMLLLRLGRFKQGWQHCEARYSPNIKDRNTIVPKFPFPQWQGQLLAGKSLVIWCEQGLGDEIQFCRYVSLLKSQGARDITWVCKMPLKPLLKTLKGVDKVLSREEAVNIGLYDYWTLPLSTPLHCNTTLDNIPATVPYLYANPTQVEMIAKELGSISEFKVGICWKGSAGHKGDATRSPGISCFKPLFELSGVRFFTLQPDTREEFILNAGTSGVDRGHEINKDSFEEAAALIMNLDLVICCDTSIGHLAGALGKTVWIVVTSVADWRWMDDREDSPWYPTGRLFRQIEQGNWAEVFQRIEKQLKQMMAEKRKSDVQLGDSFLVGKER